MPTAEDFDSMLAPVPEPASVAVGFPGMTGAIVDSENTQLRFAHNKIGVQQHTLNGNINLDGPESIRQSMGGLPIQVYDNPLGVIPSTIFTPTAAKIVGIDIELVEIALLSSFITQLLVGLS